MPDEDRIRRRAQAISEREGRPEGREQEHWAQARREIEAEEGASPPRAAKPDDSPTPAAPDHGGTTPAEAAAAVAAVGTPRKAEQAPRRAERAGRAPDDSPTPTAPDDGGTTPGEAAVAAAAVGAPRKAERTPEPSLPPDPLSPEAARIID